MAKGRAVVRGPYGITLELRGGGDEGDGDEGGNGARESRDPPALSALVLGTDNPARARNRALRAGGSVHPKAYTLNLAPYVS